MTTTALTPYTARNWRPILEVLRLHLCVAKTVLEIGSGSGQHATSFANEFDNLSWQTSDRQRNHTAIRDWITAAGLPNVLSPLSLDVQSDVWPSTNYDAVFSANTAHIMSLAAVEKMFEIVAHVLPAGGVFFLYGPFRQAGEFNADSNERFDCSLRSQDAEMGIRNLEDLDGFGDAIGLRRERLYALPANNLMAIWRKINE